MSEFTKMIQGSDIVSEGGMMFRKKISKMFTFFINCNLSHPQVSSFVKTDTFIFIITIFSFYSIMAILQMITNSQIYFSIIQTIMIYVICMNFRINQSKDFSMHTNLYLLATSHCIEKIGLFIGIPFMFRQSFKVFIVNKRDFALSKRDCFHANNIAYV